MKKILLTLMIFFAMITNVKKSYAEHGTNTAIGILTGVVAADIIVRSINPPPPPQPVYVVQQPQVVVQQPQVIYQQPQPVYVAPPQPIYVQPQPVYVVPQQPVYINRPYSPYPIIIERDHRRHNEHEKFERRDNDRKDNDKFHR